MTYGSNQRTGLRLGPKTDSTYRCARLTAYRCTRLHTATKSFIRRTLFIPQCPKHVSGVVVRGSLWSCVVVRLLDRPLYQCLSEERLKAAGPFYLGSMPGEVKDPTQWVNSVTCRGLHDSEINHSCISPGMVCLEYIAT